MYYLAKTIEYPPFLIFDLIAKSDEGLSQLKLSIEHPLVVLKSDIPEEINGVSPLMINKGMLIDRPESKKLENYKTVKENAKNSKKETLKSELKILLIDKLASIELGLKTDKIEAKIIEIKNKYSKI